MRITKITSPVVRKTESFERTDRLIVALHPRFLSIRLEGHKTAVNVDYGAVLDLARKLDWRRKAG